MTSAERPHDAARPGRRAELVALAALLIACAGRGGERASEGGAGARGEAAAAADAASSEPPALLAELEARAEAHPGDASLRYVLALLEERRGEPERALARLRELAPLGWDYALDDDDFPTARALPEYAAIARELADREPRVAGGEVVRELAPTGLFSEGIAWDPAGRAFYFGDAPARRVLRAPFDGEPSPLGGPAPGDMFSPLGMHVDPATQTLWVASVAFGVMEGYTEADAGRARLVALDLASGRARASFAIGDPSAPSLLNDVAPLPGGRAAVTDSQRGAVYLGDLAGGELRPLAPPGTFESPNGIVADEGGATLYVADLYGLSAVDTTSGRARRLPAPPGAYVGGVDGLCLVDGRLVGVQNLFGAPRIWALPLGPEGLGAPTILSSGDPRIEAPTTATIAEGALWLLANPQIRGKPGDPRAPIRLLRIPLAPSPSRALP